MEVEKSTANLPTYGFTQMPHLYVLKGNTANIDLSI